MQFPKCFRKLPIFFLVLITAACSTPVTSLQDVEVNGPPQRNTVRITQNRKPVDIEIRAQYSVNKKKQFTARVDGHSMVNSDGVYELEPVPGEQYFLEKGGVNVFPFNGDNFTWNIPESQGMLDIDLALSKYFGLTAGINYSRVNGRDYWGKNIGFAFFNQEGSWALRFDFNLKFSEMYSAADFVQTEDIELSTNETRKVYKLQSAGIDEHLNPAFMLTINTVEPDWFVNLFFNYSLGWHTFYDWNTLKNDFQYGNENFYYTESYHTLSTGIFKNIGNLGRIVAGVRFTKYTDEKGNLNVPDAFLQFDFLLFKDNK